MSTHVNPTISSIQIDTIVKMTGKVGVKISSIFYLFLFVWSKNSSKKKISPSMGFAIAPGIMSYAYIVGSFSLNYLYSIKLT